jgi:hypothetical protein
VEEQERMTALWFKEDPQAEEEEEEEEGRPCSLFCCVASCCATILMCMESVTHDHNETGEWGIEGPLNFIFGDYFGPYRYNGRLYWVAVQAKLIAVSFGMILLQPVPFLQFSFLLLLECCQLFLIVLLVPHLCYSDLVNSVVTSCFAIALYTGVVGSVWLSSVSDATPSGFSSIFVYLHMFSLLHQLIIQLLPLFSMFLHVAEAVMFLQGTKDDALELAAGADGEQALPEAHLAGKMRKVMLMNRLGMQHATGSGAIKKVRPAKTNTMARMRGIMIMSRMNRKKQAFATPLSGLRGQSGTKQRSTADSVAIINFLLQDSYCS